MSSLPSEKVAALKAKMAMMRGEEVPDVPAPVSVGELLEEELRDEPEQR